MQQLSLVPMVRVDVSALYVDARGPYPRLVADWWDAERDARRYEGPRPVVAHPPCGPWGGLRHLSRRDDPSLALRAVEQVRRWGGVLEHPARSLLWDACGLPRPGEPVDAWGGTSIEVEQVRWGHGARKRTWLYLVRCAALDVPPPRAPTHWVSGARRRKTAGGGVVPPGIKVCSSAQRRRTPPALAAWLLEVASRATPNLQPL